MFISMKKQYVRYGNYDLKPYTKIRGYDDQAVKGYDDIIIRLKKEIASGKRIIVCDFYPGVDEDEVKKHLSRIDPVLVIESGDCALKEEDLNDLFRDYLTDDRVFGFMCHKKLADCFVKEKLEAERRRIDETTDGVVLVMGVGARLITRGDVYLYFDMARWEIQLRYRRGMANWRCTNYNAPNLTKVKRGFFVEWRLADKHKNKHFEDFDYVVDTNEKENPKMITGEAFRQALIQISGRPFRLQPYFDPGVWGGHWMQQNFGLGDEEPNFAWSFDGVPEENSLNLMFGDILVVIKGLGVLITTSVASDFKSMTSCGFLIAGVGILVFLRLRRKLIDLKWLYNVALFLVELSILLLSLSMTEASYASGMLMGCAYTVFAVFCFTIYSNMCLRYRIDPIRLSALAFSCENIASALGVLLSPMLLQNGAMRTTALVALSMTIAVVFLFLFSDTGYRTGWNSERGKNSTEKIIEHYYSMPSVCSALARQYDLSTREEDILLLLLQKKSGPVIAKELYISPSTVKSHTRNIYRKLDVHSREELLALVEAPSRGRG